MLRGLQLNGDLSRWHWFICIRVKALMNINDEGVFDKSNFASCAAMMLPAVDCDKLNNARDMQTTFLESLAHQRVK